jgi:hypothetical protein
MPSPNTRIRQLESTLNKVYKLSKTPKSGKKIQRIVKKELTLETSCKCCGSKTNTNTNTSQPSSEPTKNVFVEELKSPKVQAFVESDSSMSEYSDSEYSSSNLSSSEDSAPEGYFSDSSSDESVSSEKSDVSIKSVRSESDLFGVADEAGTLEAGMSEEQLFGTNANEVSEESTEKSEGIPLNHQLSEEDLFGEDFNQTILSSSPTSTTDKRLIEMEKRLALIERGLRNSHVSSFAL